MYGFFQFNDLLADLDLNADLIWNILDKALVTGTEDDPAGFDFDQDGEKETALPITKAQFDALAAKLTYAADPIVKTSVSSAYRNRLALETDRALVCAILVDAAVDLLETDDGAAFARKAIDSLDSSVEKRIAGTLVSMLASKAGRFVLYHTQDLLAFAASAAARIKAFKAKSRA